MATGTIPLEITEKVLTAHSVTEPSVGETAWTVGATFEVGDKAIVGAPSSVVAMTIDAPGVVTWTGHNLPNGVRVLLTTTGALPTGLENNGLYYVVNRTPNTFQLSETKDGAPITTTGSQSGIHTAKASIHRVYQSLISSNTGNPPPTDDGTKWFDLGPSNLWAMTDLYEPAVTWGASPMTFTLTPGERIRSIYLGALTADAVRIVMKVGGVTKYDVTESLWARTTFNPTDFCFKPWSHRTALQKIDLPVYSNPVIEVTITRAEGLVGLGKLAIGNPEQLGQAQYGAQSKSRNFTKFDRRTDGTAVRPVKQRNVPTTPQRILFVAEAMPNLLDLRDRTNGIIVIWSSIDDDTHPFWPAFVVAGLATTFDLETDPNFPEHGFLSLVPEEY